MSGDRRRFLGPLSQQPLHLPFDGDRGLYVLSLSKFLSPDLRIALACGNPTLLQAMRADQYISERWVSHILQQIAARLWGRPCRRGSCSGRNRRIKPEGMSWCDGSTR